MAPRKKTSGNPRPTDPPMLVKPRAEVEKKLQDRIEHGRKLRDSEIQSKEELGQARKEQSKWDSYNVEYLKRCFNTEQIAEEYGAVSGWGALIVNASFPQKLESFRDGVQTKITELESIFERLELIPESQSSTHESIDAPQGANYGDSVFIVHGHDEAAKSSVARLIEKLDLKPIILHEQANKGQTLIEKFESNASRVCFAVILLTADDIGASKENPDDVKARARQNVILELGYFAGALGRGRICVLYEDDVEIPTDYLGVGYTRLDSSGGWHLTLARELKEAGMDIDLNKVV